MTPPIGFVILSHTNPDQLLSLVRRLDWMFQSPPIVCHHDFTQSPLDSSLFPKHVAFVQPSLKTQWGHISLVRAFLNALRLLYDRPQPPQWFMFLSAADYPLMAADEIVSSLASRPFDLYLTYQIVTASPGVSGDSRRFFIGTQHAYDRYRSFVLRVPSFTRRLKPTRRQFVLRNDWAVSRLGSIPRGVDCYAGDAWFTANSRVAEILLSEGSLKTALLRHYQRRLLPEESLYHTLLCNTPGLRIHDDNLRYSDWSQNQNHPKTLVRSDLERALRSGCHFGRKFDPQMSKDALSAIDEVISVGRL